MIKFQMGDISAIDDNLKIKIPLDSIRIDIIPIPLPDKNDELLCEYMLIREAIETLRVEEISLNKPKKIFTFDEKDLAR